MCLINKLLINLCEGYNNCLQSLYNNRYVPASPAPCPRPYNYTCSSFIKEFQIIYDAQKWWKVDANDFSYVMKKSEASITSWSDICQLQKQIITINN